MKQFAVNSAGVVGYLFVLLGWIWALALVLTNTGLVDLFASEQPKSSPPAVSFPEFSLPEPIAIVLLAGLAVFMIGLSVYAFLKVPAEAIKQGSRAAHKAADKLAPVVARKKPLSKKKRLNLTARLVFYIKLALIVVPVAATAGLVVFVGSDLSLAPDLVIIVSAGTGAVAMLFFALQYALARITKLPLDKML